MRNEITRREFLKRGAGAGALYSSAPDLWGSSHPQEFVRRGDPKKIIVVGAGLAGMVAAYELSEAGHDVTVLEARGRPGGRVLTLREPFADGLYAEAGPVSFPNVHHFVMRYVGRFRLSLEPHVYPSHLAQLHFLRGQRVTVKPGQRVRWPLGLTAEEQRLGIHGMMRKYLAPTFKELGDVTSPDWPPPSLGKYDDMNFAEFLGRQGASPDAVALLRLGHLDVWGDGIDRTSALVLLRERALHHEANKWYKLKGGNDLLPKAFAARLKEKIRYGTPVAGIERDAHSVRVIFQDAGTRQTLLADRVICAIPFPALRQIDVVPPFSTEKQKAIKELPYTSVTRIYLQSKKRFWIDQGLSGWAVTDLPIQWVWDMTPEGRGPRGLMQSMTCGEQARRLTAMSESERTGWALDQTEKLFSGARANFELGTSKSWDEDEWALGGYASAGARQMLKLLPHMARSEGRVHFAGEHASAWWGWQEGALESGYRAAQEVNEADGVIG